MPASIIVNQPSVTPRTDAGLEIDFATEATLGAIGVLLTALEAKDFSTEATLDAFLSAFNGEDFATQTTLQAVLDAFNAEDFAHEATLASIKDTDGIKKITDPLPAGTNLIGKVEATLLAGGIAQNVKLETGDGSGHLATVDSSKRLLVSTGTTAPAGTDPVLVIAQGNVGGNNQADTDYTVPAGETLTITQFFAGGETSGKESKFELYHSTDSGASDGTLLAFGYIGDGGQNIRVDLNYEVVGVGATQVIRMRRERLDATGRELAASWDGNVTI